MNPAPISNPNLLSHLEVEEDIARAFVAGRLHHSIILAGEKGIGKATLAFRIARYAFVKGQGSGAASLFDTTLDIASAVPEHGFEDDEGEATSFEFTEALAPAVLSKSGLDELDTSPLKLPRVHPIFERLASGGVADFKFVEREWTDEAKTKRKTEISVEQIRALKSFFATTPSEEGWRIAVIDSLDEMNANSRNALLKLLEEPPEKSLLILISHNLNAVMPTIKSRCRIFRLGTLDEEEMGALLSTYAPEADKAALLALAGGSIGRALDLFDLGGLALAKQFRESLPLVLAGKAEAAAPILAAVKGEDSMRIFREIVMGHLRELALGASLGEAERIFAAREEIIAKFDAYRVLNLDPGAVVAGVYEALKNAV